MAQRTQITSASAPAISPYWKYHVFLSFRGEDTRKGFTDYLHKELKGRGINTFRDNPDLQIGADINLELLMAIEQSRFASVVLSPTYAFSTWCLRELAHIVRWMEGKERIFPVFYGVEPSDARKQRGTFSQAFITHEKTVGQEEVRSWRDALKRVADFSGWNSKVYRYNTELIKEIVNTVWEKVHPTLLGSTDIVRIDSTLREINLLVKAEENDVRFIGIWGMGGIGKTYLARAVDEMHSYHFEFRIFLSNIKAKKTDDDLVRLQRQLLFPILKEEVAIVGDVYHGTRMINNCLRDKKVLLILDDVDELNQLEKLAGEKDWFGKGSRIIVTTRDQRLLVAHDIEYQYEIKELKGNEAVKLFSWKAFKKERPEEDFFILSQYVLNYARGLPLALTTLGAFLYKRDKAAWKSVLDILKKSLDGNIFETLKISYDGLNEMQRQVFLDVACFLKGDYKGRVIEMLDIIFGFDTSVLIDVLIEKSLLTILDNCVVLHDLIQEMAFKIIQLECEEEPGRRSRLWSDDDIYHVLKENTGTESIRGITLCWPKYSEQQSWNPNAFSKMSKLKFLKMNGVILSEVPKYLPASIRILQWMSYRSNYLPPRFQVAELVELNLQYSAIHQLWDGRKYSKKLKYINLSNSGNLTKTPDFTGLQNLEMLIFESCLNLVEIHPSIAFLKRLKVLNFKFCGSIENLPSKVEMESLEVFDLYGCYSVKQIPEFEGQMKCLSDLRLRDTDIEKIPSSIECLVGLTSLVLTNCTRLMCLPSCICSLKSLKHLSLYGCSKLGELPENLGNIESLEELDVCGTIIRELPSSIFHMKNLKLLAFDGNGEAQRKSCPPTGLVLPSSLQDLRSLTKLYLNDCNLCEVPYDIGSLSSLEYLSLFKNHFISLPESIGCLYKMKVLDLRGCKRLQKLPPLGSLCELEKLDMSECERLQMLPHLPSTTELSINIENCGFIIMSPDDLPELSRLVKLNFGASNCFRLVDNQCCNRIISKVLNQFIQGVQHSVEFFQVVIPGREIPEWCSNQCVGNSVILWQPPCSPNNRRVALSLCVIVGAERIPDSIVEFDDWKNHRVDISCYLVVPRIKFYKSLHATVNFVCTEEQVKSDHLWLFCSSGRYNSGHVTVTEIFNSSSQIEFTFEVSSDVSNWSSSSFKFKVKKCGVRLVDEQGLEVMNQTIDAKRLQQEDVQSVIIEQTHEHYEEAGPSRCSSSRKEGPPNNTRKF